MAINIEDFDLSVSPADDFASYVNGKWKKNNQSPSLELKSILKRSTKYE